ncbi:MAG: MotA/TolQ/ExbB proton channel family protein [Rubrivivax sp.]|nr:MAG: MotA/TolQ/ExbB proton channel family protein [Rubrivivax sp.]
MSIKKLSSAAAALALVAALGITALGHQPALAQDQASTATPVTAVDSKPAVTAPAAATKETVDNPYGIEALWSQGDLVARGTLIILILMSAGSWYILVTKLYESYKLASQAREARKTFFRASSLQEGAQKLKEGSAFRFIAESSIEASNHHEGELTENIDRNTWVTLSVQRAIDEVQARQQDGLAFLGTVGSTSPFIGLFGTVWGILHALTAIGVAGQASIDKVAGPVGESLLMTAIGLAVAVPAVLGYNWIVRRNKVTLDAARSFAAELHGVLLGAKPIRLVGGGHASATSSNNNAPTSLPVAAARAAG